MSAKPSVVAVIPTYRPPEQVKDLVRVLTDGVDAVVISDDASPCTSDELLHDIREMADVEVLRHHTNAGIARGLNEGLPTAQRLHAPWLLTFDQDSLVDGDYLPALISCAEERILAGERLGALGAEVILDASGPMTYPLTTVNGQPVTEELIQTGTLWNVAALTEVGGFDESMWMDAVDAAACLALRRSGFSVGVAEGLQVQHEIGSSTMVMIGGRPVMVTGHSPDRRASMLRSRLRLLPAEFAQSPRHAMRTIRRVMVNQSLGLMIEGQRWQKAKGTIRGLLPSRGR